MIPAMLQVKTPCCLLIVVLPVHCHRSMKITVACKAGGRSTVVRPERCQSLGIDNMVLAAGGQELGCVQRSTACCLAPVINSTKMNGLLGTFRLKLSTLLTFLRTCVSGQQFP